MNEKTVANPVAALCPQCGLCCNGVLFADVELRRADRPAALERLGLKILKKGRKRAFAQPCSCFDGKLCTIYRDRPAYCAAFECGLLQRVAAGEGAVPSALKTIALAKRKVARVELLLKKLGAADPGLPLTQRYANAMRAPVELARGGGGTNHPGKLMLAMAELMELLQTEFLR
jgi:Fe-S-cluster containining protein